MIYVITTFSEINKDYCGFPYFGAIRSVAYYTDYNSAREAILNNNCDMYEYLYKYAVLESLPEGMYPTTCNGYSCEYFKYIDSIGGYEPMSIEEFNDKLAGCRDSEISGLIWSIG